MALLNDVKASLRITHTMLDDDISANIDAAKAELARAGVAEEAINEDDPLIVRAIKTYCAQFYAIDQTQAAQYQASFEYQADNMRKTPHYSVVTANE